MIDIKFVKEENRAVAYDNEIEIGECSYAKSDRVIYELNLSPINLTHMTAMNGRIKNIISIGNTGYF